jgi:hypothetical protein
MAGGFDTAVDGSPHNVRAMASWLRGSLKTAVEQAADDTVTARQEAMSGFRGQAGDAYHGYTTTMITYLDEHAATVVRAAQSFDDYAARLQQCEDRMAAFRGAAAHVGLTVTGTVIHEPPPAEAVAALPAGATRAQRDAHDVAMGDHDAAVLKIQLYDQLLADAEWEVTSLGEWIDAHLTADVAGFASPDVSRLLANLRENAGSLGLAAALEASRKRSERLQDRLRDRYQDRRSGDPRRSSGAREPEARAKIRQLVKEAGLLRRGIAVLGPGALLYDTYQGLEEDKPGGGLLAVAAGAAGTAVVIALAPVEAPAVGVVIVAVGVGYAVSEATQAGWEQLPDGVTDPVDEAVGDAWDDVEHGAVEGARAWLDVTGFR